MTPSPLHSSASVAVPNGIKARATPLRTIVVFITSFFFSVTR